MLVQREIWESNTVNHAEIPLKTNMTSIVKNVHLISINLSLVKDNQPHEIHETCHSVIFYYVKKNSFSDISRKYILPNMFAAKFMIYASHL